MNVGALRHMVTLENPGADVPDGDGGYTQAWTALVPSPVSASIVPATARDLERVVATTVDVKASHMVTIRYHPQVTTETRVTFGTRRFQVTGIQNPEERNIALVLVCDETVA